MALQYQESYRLKNGHPGGVACLSFSPDRSLLASGGIEGNICVWDLKTQKLLTSSASVGKGSVSVLSCVWKKDRNDSFICGIQDGSIAEVTLTASKISILGIRAHNYPVEKLAVDENRVVSGAQKQVRVWKSEADEKWVQIAELEGPPLSRMSSAELIVTGLFFTKAENEKTLLVAYMHHGIMIHDVDFYGIIKSIPYSGILGSCDLHPDGASLAASNCRGAFEIYRFETERRKSLQAAGEDHRSLPVLFIHDGLALLTGSSTGKVRVWDPVSKHVQDHFNTGKGTQILAVAASHQVNLDYKEDNLFIAAGITSATAPCDIILWAAQPRRQETARLQAAMKQTNPSFMRRMCYRLGQLIVLFGLVAIFRALRPFYPKSGN